MEIVVGKKEHHIEIMQIWEESVRATHSFLSEEHLQELAYLIQTKYLDAVKLYVVKDEKHHITGFLGVANGKVEMLFVSLANFRIGIGKMLINFAIHQLGITEVDVNEQNIGAFDFYASLGFKIFERSPTDGQGWPYPILHLKL